MSGRWAAESQLTREAIHTGTKVLESRKGHTSHNFNPWFAIDAVRRPKRTGASGSARWPGAATGGSPWSRRRIDQVRVTGGLNTFDFAYPLKPGESLETPPFYGGFSDGRLRRHVAPHAPLRTDARFCPTACTRVRAGALQLLGSDRVRRE